MRLATLRSNGHRQISCLTGGIGVLENPVVAGERAA
jgi:hypothetical protein